MRLWHKYLISVLPREQLVSQWRECSALASNIQKKGSPNHILCNFILNYDYDHFISYAYYIREEMTKRGYRTMNSVWNKIVSLKTDYKLLSLKDIYPEEMNDTYWTICYYNLMEKWLRGGIKNEDWMKIDIADSEWRSN
jgi:uncharacterized protein (TIGR02328 family)